MTLTPQQPAPLMLDLAPPARSPVRFLPVILAGLLTTGVALAGVYALDRFSDTNVMGWYANGFLPIGALLVGFVASVGYGIASWRTGLKIRWSLLLAILALQLIAYFVAQYIVFVMQGPLVEIRTGRVIGFWKYYDLITVNMTWQDSMHPDRPADPLGSTGYWLRFGEIVGFLCGTLIGPALLFKVPYCELCQRYMKRQRLITLPASPGAFASVAVLQTPEEALDSGAAQSKALAALAAAGDVAGFVGQVTPLFADERQASKGLRRITLRLDHCKQCHNGVVRRILTTGKGKKETNVMLDSTTVSSTFVNDLLATPAYVHRKR
jgi:hypothetical protein